MCKQQASKSVCSPAGCIFDGVPPRKLQRLQAIQAAASRAIRMRPVSADNLLIPSTFDGIEQQLVK